MLKPNYILVKRILNCTSVKQRVMSMIEFEDVSIREILPVLDDSKYKGQCGRIGVIGGSREYTGAPYFAGMSALRLGSDLVHIFCTESAGVPIKCYSPELIVHPVLNDENVLNQFKEWLPRLHAVLVGPGLGRDNIILERVTEIIEELIKSKKPIVIDADGLYIITQIPDILVGAKYVTLTPNKIEFKRLCDAISKKIGKDADSSSVLDYFGDGVTIVEKGKTDKILNKQGHTTVEGGSPCRCGGQGDVLSGSIALFTHWAHQAGIENPSLFGAYSGCTITKRLSKMVYGQIGRSMVAGDLIPAIPKVLKEFEDLNC